MRDIGGDFCEAMAAVAVLAGTLVEGTVVGSEGTVAQDEPEDLGGGNERRGVLGLAPRDDSEHRAFTRRRLRRSWCGSGRTEQHGGFGIGLLDGAGTWAGLGLRPVVSFASVRKPRRAVDAGERLRVGIRDGRDLHRRRPCYQRWLRFPLGRDPRPHVWPAPGRWSGRYTGSRSCGCCDPHDELGYADALS